MLARCRRLLSSISVKLFLWFWLVAIVSIVTTRFISEQLNDNGFILPAHHGDLRLLRDIAGKISRDQPINLAIYMKHLQLNKRQTQALPERVKVKTKTNVWLKDASSNQLISMKIDQQAGLPQYLTNNSFSGVVTVQFSHARITGPIDTRINNKNFQLYIAHKDDNRHLDKFLMQLPPWARFTIPLLISFSLCWLLARNLSRPLSSIQGVVTRLGDGDLSVRVEKVAQRNDELGSLAKTFNQMAEKLTVSLSAQQRLIGDVSHELRSPMTRLQLALGLAQKQANDPIALTKYLQRCESEVQRLDAMIADVLVLSRLENALHSLNLQKFNFSGLLDILLEDARFIADAKSISIKQADCAAYQLRADSQLLASAISNILTNAVKYSPPGSEITVSVQQAKDRLLLSISDAGEGVPEQSLALLFEPFYRVTQARERQTGGTGLGLAIAKQSILAHQGRIYAQRNPLVGLTVTIEVPLNNQAAA